MEQAVNTFNKGLLLDTHPMVQGNDSLSDALNATFVTMNGNEIILQNDMGNRRVDNAFLPPGYEPVGMKEYGGIIYVAAYNPITNKSQIGSFPSPERKIDSLDDKNLGLKGLDFFSKFYEKSNLLTERRFIKNDVIMIPLTGDISIHAGDKFAIYWNLKDYEELNMGFKIQNYITNYNNVHPNNKKINSPKNKYITMSLGILNSQNLFVDVTKNLKRWKNGNFVKYDSSYSLDYIFNDGYFIAELSIEDSSSYTMNDRELIKSRQVVEANTYAYKLVGPLYLKIKLNHIEDFNFDINGNRLTLTITITNENNLLEDKIIKEGIELFITANITYNCPDSSARSGGNSKYFDLRCGKISNWIPFDFYIKENNKYVKKENGNGCTLTYTFNENPTYDEETNLYKVKVNVKYVDEKYNYVSNPVLEYFIGVDSGIPINGISGLENRYYIETLSSYNSIDISKFGSGEAYLKSFRFFNNIDKENPDNNYTTVTYFAELYPRIGLLFKYLQFEINEVDSLDEEEFILIPNVKFEEDYSKEFLPFNNGKNTFLFNWEKYGLKLGKLYEIIFWYFNPNHDGSLLLSRLKDLDENTTRWLLTTKLFNDCYNPLSEDFVEDYGDKIYPPGNPKYNEKLYNKLKVIPKINKNRRSNSKINNKVYNGKLVEDSNEGYILYYIENSFKLNETIEDTIDIDNKELYPNKIYFTYTKPINITINNITKNINNVETEKLGNITSFDNDTLELLIDNEKLKLIDYDDITKTNFTIKGNIKYRDIILSRKSLNKIIKKGFVKIHSDNFKDIILDDGRISHTGFFVANEDIDGPRNYQIFVLVKNHVNLTIPVRDHTCKDYDSIGEANYKEYQDHDMNIDFDNDKILDFYNSMNDIDQKYTFAYIFSGINIVGTDERCLAYVDDINDGEDAGIRPLNSDHASETVEKRRGICPITACKVWWRNTNGSWTLMNPTNGVFGGNSSINGDSYMFPRKITINGSEKPIYVGVDTWDNSEHYHNINLLYTEMFSSSPIPLILNINIDTETIGGLKFRKYINELVKRLIIDFIDPEKKLIYCLYKNLPLSNVNLFTIDSNDYIYNRHYSGGINLHINYDFNENEMNTIKVKILDNNDSSIFDILPFYLDKLTLSELITEGIDIYININSDDSFEDEINDIINNGEIDSIYISNDRSFGIYNDKFKNKLSLDTIYKIINQDEEILELEPILNSPMKVKELNNSYNTLVCDTRDQNSSSPPRYLRAFGENGSRTSLLFSGRELRVISNSSFYNL